MATLFVCVGGCWIACAWRSEMNTTILGSVREQKNHHNQFSTVVAVDH